MKNNVYLLLGVFAVLYAAVALSLSLPYRFFPSGDIAEYGLAASGGLYELLTSAAPLHSLYLAFCVKAWGLFSQDGASALVLAAALANAGGVFLCGAAAYLMAESAMCAYFAALVYAFSAWPLHYGFTYSFAPFAALFPVSVFALFAMKRGGLVGGRLILLAAGLAAGAQMWAYPAGALSVAALALAVILMLRPSSWRESLAAGIVFAAAFAAALLFVPGSWQALAARLHDNLYSPHYLSALDIFAEIPRAHFLFPKTMWVFSPLLSVALLLVAALRLAVFFWSNSRISKLWRDNPVADGMLAYILLYASALEALPFSATAKIQLPLFAVAVPLVCVAGYHVLCVATEKKTALRRPLALLLLGALCVSGFFGALDDRMARRFVPDYLKSLLSKAPVALLEEDPHSEKIAAWLGEGQALKTLPSAALAAEAEAAGTDGLYLIVGPHGPQSGLSSAGGCVLGDYSPNLFAARALLERAPTAVLPYYSSVPAELVEEPVCQALYFSGKIKAYLPQSAGLTIFHLLSKPKDNPAKTRKEGKHVR